MQDRTLGLLGRKLGMTQIFGADGRALGVTVLELGPCVVLAKRSKVANGKGKSDGYTALQLGFAAKPERKVTKSEAGALKAAGGNGKARRFVREVRVPDAALANVEIGAELSLKDLGLKPGDRVDVIGRSKGGGFQGVLHRYHFKGFNASHGTHEYFRHGGAIGNRKWPGRVMKGRRMPGHTGDERVTTPNVRVAAVRNEENILLVHGSVPGPNSGYVLVCPAFKAQKL